MKYKTTYIDLKTRESKPIKLEDIHNTPEYSISIGFEGLKRSPIGYFVTYKGITAYATHNALKPAYEVIEYISNQDIPSIYKQFDLI